MEDELPDASIDDRQLTFSVRYSGGLEFNVFESLKNMDLEKIDQVLKDDWNVRQLPKHPTFVQDLAYGSVCEITCAEKSNSWTVGEIFSKEQRWVVIAVLVESWFSKVLQECGQLNNQQRWSHKSSQLCGWPMQNP